MIPNINAIVNWRSVDCILSNDNSVHCKSVKYNPVHYNSVHREIVNHPLVNCESVVHGSVNHACVGAETIGHVCASCVCGRWDYLGRICIWKGGSLNRMPSPERIIPRSKNVDPGWNHIGRIDTVIYHSRIPFGSTMRLSYIALPPPPRWSRDQTLFEIIGWRR